MPTNENDDGPTICSTKSLEMDMKSKINITLSPLEQIKRIFSHKGIKYRIYNFSSFSQVVQIPTIEALGNFEANVTNAIKSNDIMLLKMMLKNGYIFKFCDESGVTPMHIACRLGNKEMAVFLRTEAMIPLRIVDEVGRTPMHYACSSDKCPDLEILEWLISESPELILISDEKNLVPLEYIDKRYWDVVNDLLKQKEHSFSPERMLL